MSHIRVVLQYWRLQVNVSHDEPIDEGVPEYMGHRHRHRQRDFECSKRTKVVLKGQRRLLYEAYSTKERWKVGFSWPDVEKKELIFEKMIVKFMQVIAPALTAIFVVDRRKESFEDRSKKFEKFQNTCYATDVKFQQSNRPGGNMAEEKSILVVITTCTVTKLKHMFDQMGYALDLRNMFLVS